jgi:uncharacterized protein (DUF488 family)
LYEKTVLETQEIPLKNLYDIFMDKKRVALTCFEKDPKFCHRTRIAKYITSQPQWKYETKEL